MKAYLSMWASIVCANIWLAHDRPFVAGLFTGLAVLSALSVLADKYRNRLRAKLRETGK